MRKGWVIAIAGCVLLAGCGTLLDIQPDTTTAGDGGGVPVADGAPVDAPGADAAADGEPADAADAAPSALPCGVAPAADPCVLAAGLVDLGSIAAGGGNVYFARHESSGPIFQVPSAGGSAPTQFASGSNLPTGLFATDVALYWVTEGDKQIVRQPFGTATTPVASVDNTTLTPARIVVVGAEAFWTEPGTGANNGQVRGGPSMPLGPGGAIAPMETMPTALAADVDFVYYADKITSGKIGRVSHDGVTKETTSGGFSQVTGLALADAAKIVAITSAAGVQRASTETAATFMGSWTLVSSTTTGVDLVADADGTLYVLDGDGSLEIIANMPAPAVTKMPIAGCTIGRGIAQDPMHVYLACKDSIVRVHK